MKKTTALLVLCMIPLVLRAQDQQTLINGNVRHGGFGGPMVAFASINNDLGVLAGGRGGWIINMDPEHAIVLGGGGYGLTTDVKANASTIDGAPLYLDFGYGGFILEYVNRTGNLVHPEFQVMIGGGAVDLREKGQPFDASGGDVFFALEPGVNLMLNVTRFFRLGAGAYYRYINGVDLAGIDESDLRGFAATVTFKFGRF